MPRRRTHVDRLSRIATDDVRRDCGAHQTGISSLADIDGQQFERRAPHLVHGRLTGCGVVALLQLAEKCEHRAHDHRENADAHQQLDYRYAPSVPFPFCELAVHLHCLAFNVASVLVGLVTREDPPLETTKASTLTASVLIVEVVSVTVQRRVKTTPGDVEE